MASETLAKLTDQSQSLKDRLEVETELEASLKEKIANADVDILAKRKEMATQGGVNAAMDNTKAVAKQIRVLENRLDQMLIKFNEGIAANRNLREQIDTLRRE